MEVFSCRHALLSRLRRRLVNCIVFAACFIPALAISLPAVAQGATVHEVAQPQNAHGHSEKSPLLNSLPPGKQWKYYACRRWGHEVLKRKRKHCIAYHVGECIMVPPAILCYALQGADLSNATGPVVLEITGAGLGMFAIGGGMMYLGSRHEARHAKKFLSP